MGCRRRRIRQRWGSARKIVLQGLVTTVLPSAVYTSDGTGRDTRVLMKLIVDATTDRVVGCHIVGDGAAEMVQVLGIAVKLKATKLKATKADFDSTMALHPTAAEELVTMRTPSAPCASSRRVAAGARYRWVETAVEAF